MSSTGYMYRYSTTTLVLLNFNVYRVFHDFWLTSSNHVKISIKILTLNNQHAEFPINWFWVVWRRVLIFFTLLEVWKIKRTFCNHVCMSQRAVSNWSNKGFLYTFFPLRFDSRHKHNRRLPRPLCHYRHHDSCLPHKR